MSGRTGQRSCEESTERTSNVGEVVDHAWVDNTESVTTNATRNSLHAYLMRPARSAKLDPALSVTKMFRFAGAARIGAIDRMATRDADAAQSERPLMRFRMLAETARAVVVGAATAAFSRPSSVAAAPAVGDPAPDFELSGSDGGRYQLRDFRGRQPVILAWFPKAFTGGCTAECRSLAAYAAAIAQTKAQCFAASVDAPATNAEFAGALGLTYPILSDPDKRVARAYGVLGASGFASRWTFYIGVDGRILYIDRQVRTSSHGSDVAARLKELGFA